MKICILICIASTLLYAESVTFTFGNGEVTGSDPYYYEFDILAAGGSGGTRLGDCMVYFNYNMSGFGANIVDQGNVSVTKGALTSGELVSGSGLFLYKDPIAADNTGSCCAVTILYNYQDNPEYGNSLGTSPSVWAHVKINIQSRSETSGLSFNESLMAGQQYQSDNDPANKYDPVTADDTDDSSLPVTLSILQAGCTDHGIVISWQTQSEIECAGFYVWRSFSKSSGYERITPVLIKSKGSGAQGAEYSYTDRRIEERDYYYQIEEVSICGNRVYYGPVHAVGQQIIPDAYDLSQNYPNPFNPSTRINYQLPVECKVLIDVININGERVRRLVDREMAAGYYSAAWDGTDETGQNVHSGVYFIRLRTLDFQRTRKMMLVH